ncbi:hypothetical protein HF086_011309 [Spodoptera exigua]|uniref:thioredoxin-dependent peroxiredoxin n=1 Tax=Spodoptera exigua TaxID=7107 RepID=A0A922SFF0_SPOEX|nr:hypothetical protein HF086_011309 [Spodoptera exigua]
MPSKKNVRYSKSNKLNHYGNSWLNQDGDGSAMEVFTPAVASVKNVNFSTTSAVFVPKVQQPAPNFEATAVINGEFNKLKLADYHGKYVVLIFYPLDFTFVCPTELIAFSDRAKEFASIDCQIIGVSTDSEFSHLAWTNTPRKDGGLGKIEIPLLADYSKKISQDYNVLLDAGFALRVCPANWNPDTNAATIKPSPKASKEYFEKAN